MTDMVERVAKAIFSTLEGDVPHWRNGLYYGLKYEAEASAAIKAMREPTDAMWKAGCASTILEPGQKCLSPDDCELVFEAMIDAALETRDS